MDDGLKKGAVGGLKSVENAAATSMPPQVGENVAETKRNEEDARGLYSGVGREAVNIKQGRFKGILKKRGPIAAIIFMIFGVGGIMSATQLFQPFSLVAQFQETFNSMHVATNMRSNTFFKLQMDTGRYKNPIKGTIFSGETFRITPRQQAKLAAQGIVYDGDYNGVRVLKYQDDSGNVKIVTADADAAARLRASGDDAVDFRALYADNVDFFTRYNSGSTTWRGAIANWFGSLTDKFLINNKLSRNIFDNYRQKVEESGGNAKLATQDIIARRTDDIDNGGFRSKSVDEEYLVEVVDEKTGETKYVPYWAEVDPATISPDKTPDGNAYVDRANVNESFDKMKRSSMTAEQVRTSLDSISGKVQKGANIACTVMNVVGAISLLVTAAEAIQIINLTTSYFESVDKVKAGYGDDSPIHVLSNALNEKTVSKNTVLLYDGNGSDSESNITTSGVKALSTEERVSEKTAMQASGIAALYGSGKVDTNDPSVQSFNFSGNIKRILGGIGVSMAGFEACAIAKIASNAVSAITSSVQIAGCILGAMEAVFTFGISAGACAGIVASLAKSIAFSVAIGVTVAAVIATVTPLVTNVLMRDLVADLGGEDLGNALASGGNMYLANTHRANGGSLATMDKYKEFAIAHQDVIAENARLERESLSPFDITSKYTFMGTLLTQMMGFFATNTLMSTITTGGSVLTSSLVALTPTALAYDLEESLPSSIEEYADNCPYLASIGAVGDAYCNPYAITDVSTMEMDPVDVLNTLEESGNFQDTTTSDGNVKIDGKSDLAKYILFCNNRESAFGIADANIVNRVSYWGYVETGNNTFNNVVNSAIGAVPVVGDVIDVVSNQQALDNLGYVSGESCVAGNTVNRASSPGWNTAKYYQRFVEDQSLAESMGVIEKSAVTAYLDEYYEKNPLDNSYEGMLARYSGLDKDTVVALLNLVEYGTYIADYHPGERYAFSAPVVEIEEGMNFDSENIAGNRYILLDEISFSDIRNRSFAV